jgi:putative ABC transport system substrate-binding protein
VDKIFKGTKVGDLPVQQPARFELLVNLRSARSLGLSISESFLLQADKVIE